MRTIKYKALGTKGWAQTETNGWYFGTNVVEEYLNKELRQTSSLAAFERMLVGNYYDKDTRCQFTGEIDSAGTEIYENDKVRFIVSNKEGTVHFGKAHLTVNDNYCGGKGVGWYILIDGEKEMLGNYQYNWGIDTTLPSNLVVIGNIHDR
jgi:uncharacterized phage protein (TIGR01671 family)